MKLITVYIAGLFIIGCGKTPNNESNCKADLVITKTITPANTTITTGINSTVDAYGSNLCYSYSHNEIAVASGNIYQIRIKGNISCNAAICAQALYPVQTHINIQPVQAGTYYLQFFNYDALVKTDTVVVQ
jgi:hypothetical protein